jgi:hypothetical protein
MQIRVQVGEIIHGGKSRSGCMRRSMLSSPAQQGGDPATGADLQPDAV